MSIMTTPDGYLLLPPGLADLTTPPSTLWVRHTMTPDEVAQHLRELPTLRHVHTDTAGTDHLPDMPDRVTLTTTDANTAPVAEYVLAVMLADTVNVAALEAQSSRREWATVHRGTLDGARVEVVGSGRIGNAVRELLRPFGAHVTITPSRTPGAVDVRDADWLVVTCPLSDETRGAINDRVLTPANGLALVDVSRGNVIHDQSLARALRGGHVRRAWLDVHPEEPLRSSSWRWSDPRVTVTAHTAWTARDVERRRVRSLLVHRARVLGHVGEIEVEV